MPGFQHAGDATVCVQTAVVLIFSRIRVIWESNIKGNHVTADQVKMIQSFDGKLSKITLCTNKKN